jgi:ABC-type phosphate transport system permease subunit
MTSIGRVATEPLRQPLREGRAGNRSVGSMAFLVVLWMAMAFAVICLFTLLADAFTDGFGRLDGNLFTRYTSQVLPERAGARAAILGSAMIIVTTAAMAIPLGIAAAAYLEEFADSERWYNRLIEVNLQNLAAVPAIVYGMLTAGFALAIGLERRVVLSGAIALALLILPVIIITTREALRAVPAEIRQGSLALGATPLQTVWRQTLPSARPRRCCCWAGWCSSTTTRTGCCRVSRRCRSRSSPGPRNPRRRSRRWRRPPSSSCSRCSC